MPRLRKDRFFGPELPRIPGQAFPNTLAAIVYKSWNCMCSGQYVAPPCPPKNLLKVLIETVYLTSSAPEEDRFPHFSVVATPIDGIGENQGSVLTILSDGGKKFLAPSGSRTIFRASVAAL